MQSVFIASGFSWASKVRGMHERLRAHGIECLSTWADDASGQEDFGAFTDAELRLARASNYAGVAECDVLMFLADSPAREAFLEVAAALHAGKRVMWIGRDTLSTRVDAFPTVTRFRWIEDALAHVIAMAQEGRAA
jgi:hypothetical protein